MFADSSVTVIICAFSIDRWLLTNAAIESALAQPETDEVVIVIDHNPALLDLARSRWSSSAVVIPNSHARGLSGARNSGIEAAVGSIIGFLDDDARATENWLATLLEPLADASVAAVGGSARPVWPQGVEPRQLGPELYWIVGCSYRGLPTDTADVRNVIGCSMAFRRESLVHLGGFDEGIGRIGSLGLGCEETELCIRLTADDPSARIVFVPASVVHHSVSADRVRWHYIAHRSFLEGVSKAVLVKSLGASSGLSSESGYARHVLPRAMVEAVRTGRPGRALSIPLSLAAASLGFLFGLVAASRARTVGRSRTEVAA
jgi:GT2 family glycosyltransferase